MRVSDLVKGEKTSVSFEFFPPKTDVGVEELFRTIRSLESCNPSFVSVTYGAGGSTREKTHEVVERIIRETSIPTVPHLTCVCHSREEIREILVKYANVGVKTVLALRGDPPQGADDYDRGQDDFPFAEDLVREVASFNKEQELGGKTGFGIGVAGFPEGHPETQNRLKEMDFFKRKIDAGADYIATQLFFDNRDFYDFCERCELAGITVPIIAGVMPITSKSSMIRMAELAAGAKFPAKLQRVLNAAGDDKQAVERAGVDYFKEQVADLVAQQVAGVHLFTLNKSAATREVVEDLGLNR